MKFQSNRSSCGPAALHNALAALGIERTEDELQVLCKTTASGTGVRGLVSGIRSISTPEQPLLGAPIHWRRADLAEIGAWYYISDQGRPLIMCVDQHEHWVTCAGHLGSRYAVLDSADNRMAIYYTWAELRERWVSPEKRGYYAIVV